MPSLSERFASMKREMSLQQTQVVRFPARSTAPRLVNVPRALGSGGISKVKGRTPQMQTQIARKIASKAKNKMFQNTKVQKRVVKKDSLGGYPLAAITQALLEASAGIEASQNTKEVKNNRGKPASKRVEKKPMKSRLGVQARLGAQPSSGPSRVGRNFSSSFGNNRSNMSSRLGQRQNPASFPSQRGNFNRRNASQGFLRGNNSRANFTGSNNQSGRIGKRYHQPQQVSGLRSKGQRRYNNRRGYTNPW